jgi:hypothetical protein
MVNHHNMEYDGGSPDLPLRLGDRYYAQDRVRDFWHHVEVAGRRILESYGVVNPLVSGGKVNQGAGATLSISAAVGYASYQVKVPDPSVWAIPPASALRTIPSVRIEMPTQTDYSGWSGTPTLDGVTVNYLKLRYAEIDGSTRTRAKKAGSYAYERVPSWLLQFDSTAPTDYDCLLATVVGTALTSGNNTITQAQHYQPRLSGIFPSGDYLLAGNAAYLDNEAVLRKYQPLKSFSINITNGTSGPAVCALTKKLVLLVYQDWKSGVTGPIKAALGNANTGSLGSLITIETPGDTTQRRCWCVRLSDTAALVVYGTSGGTPKAAVVTVTSESSLMISADTPVAGPEAIINWELALCPMESTTAGVVYLVANIVRARVISVSGTTPSWGTAADVTSTGTNQRLTASVSGSPNVGVGVTAAWDLSGTGVKMAAWPHSTGSATFGTPVQSPVTSTGGDPTYLALFVRQAPGDVYSIAHLFGGQTDNGLFVKATESYDAVTAYPYNTIPAFNFDLTKVGAVGGGAEYPIVQAGGPCTSIAPMGGFYLPVKQCGNRFVSILVGRKVALYEYTYAAIMIFEVFGGGYVKPIMQVQHRHSGGVLNAHLHFAACGIDVDSAAIVIGEVYSGTNELYFAIARTPDRVVGVVNASGSKQPYKSGVLGGFSGLTPGAVHYINTSGNLSVYRSMLRVGIALSTTEMLLDVGGVD